MEWAEQDVIAELINIASTSEPTTHESIPNNVVQDQFRYYVDMFTVSTIINFESISLIKIWLKPRNNLWHMWE